MECVRMMANQVITMPRWLNMDLAEDLCVEAHVMPGSLAILLLQRHLDQQRMWCLVASWGQCLETMEW